MMAGIDDNGAGRDTVHTEPAGIAVRIEPAGIAVANVERWFAEHVPHVVAPFRYALLAGGHSNLTYRVTGADGQHFVLRRPPLSSVLATAHDMGREWRVIHALQGSSVPVPPAHAFCSDPAVIGAPFYVMGLVDGYVQHTIDDTLANSSPAQRTLAGNSLFDVLADLHAIDVDAVGLGDHGPRTGYLERQIKRWYKQFTASKTVEVPDIDTSYARLLDHLPTHSEVTIAHGDYRFGNCITSFDGPIVAVLDWEISTLGDPLADLAYCLNTWVRPGNHLDTSPEAALAPTMADGYGSAEDMLQRYATRSGRDVSHIEYYVAFNHWKSACIAQGVLARYLSGALGDTANFDLTPYPRSIATRSAMARELLERF